MRADIAWEELRLASSIAYILHILHDIDSDIHALHLRRALRLQQRLHVARLQQLVVPRRAQSAEHAVWRAPHARMRARLWRPNPTITNRSKCHKPLQMSKFGILTF